MQYLSSILFWRPSINLFSVHIILKWYNHEELALLKKGELYEMVKIGQSMHPFWVNGDLGRLSEELLQIKEAGAECCELVLPGLDVVIGGKVIRQRQEAVLGILREYGFEYTLHMPHGLNLIDAKMLEMNLGVFRAGIEFAQSVGIKIINYHAGTTKTNDKSLIHNEAEQIKKLAASAPDILFCMENPLFFTDDEFSAALDAEDSIEFWKQVGLENFKLTFDIGHSFLRHGGDAAALLSDFKQLLPYAGHIHLHDNCGVKMDMKAAGHADRLSCGIGDIHLPLGWGRLPMDEIFALLNSFKQYNGIVNLEIERRFCYQYTQSISLVRESLATLA